jgi:hypothetical protein
LCARRCGYIVHDPLPERVQWAAQKILAVK